jgi:hypothetical protein
MRAQTYTQPRLGPMLVRQPIKVVCGCKGCSYVASALDESRAIRAWAAHRVRMHQQGGHRGNGNSN